MGNRRGQTTAEYAVVVGVVIAAIVAMQIYVKRGMQAKVKDVTDNFTSQAVGGRQTSQYEPYYASSDYTVAQDRTAHEEVAEGYKVDKTGIEETTTRTGSATTGVAQAQ